ncbi:MAG: efflux RND transporter periplasmic adaptor subunit [Bacteroidaceae bacterium]|nr:efflux RND transporter periplasmic adaptor subunit [Bacteroidaceae bacterium]
MKKHLTIIAMAAIAIMTSCGSSDKTATTAAVQDEKPKVKIAASTVQDVDQLAEYTTTVEAEVKNNIAPNSPLRIGKILVEVGDNVAKGQKLVQLDASNLEQLALQIENQKVEFNRISELYKVGGASKAELDNAKTALDVNIKAYNNRMENTIMRSPINGVVTARNYDNGDMTGAAPILVVEQITPVKMNINVSEPYYAKIDKKTEVSVRFEAYGEEQFPATVSIVYPTIDATTHTFPVELKINNKDRRVRPGMYGRAIVNFGTKSHVVVPDQAVIKQLGSGDYYVYVYNNGKVSYNKVTLGRRMGDKYEIVNGVEPGSQVVVAGQNRLANGVEVEVIK